MHEVQALRETDPRRIGPYEVVGRLGAGGMGEVYLAEARTGVRLAVKVVRGEHAEDRTFRARFRHEVRAAQTVGGAGTYTARVVDADTEDERPWMATEFVDGPNLRDAVLDHGALPEPAVRMLAAALGEALIAIHAKGLVHRDLKPSNILLAPDGPRVIDFGIVRALEATALTRTGTVVGSVGHVSPEQIRNGAEVGPPSDVFSLGTVLAYAAAGREPFGEGQDSVILLRILTRDFDLSGVPDGLRPLVESCLRAEPGERPTPAEVVEAAGHSARSLRESVRPGWFTDTAVEPVAGDHRWVAARDSGERESRVEYVAPTTVTDTPVPVPVPVPVPEAPPPLTVLDVPAPPGRRSGSSRRGLLRALAGGAAVAAVGGGVGGWLWLREPDGGDGSSGTRKGGGASVSASPSATGGAAPAKILWEAKLGATNDGSGPCAALSPDGKTIYATAADGTLYALGANGKQKWKLRLASEDAEYVSISPPSVASDGIVFAVLGPETERGVAGSLVAVGPAGERRWSRKLRGIYGEAPAPAGDLVLAIHGEDTGPGGVRAYDTDGNVVWDGSFPAGPDVSPLVVGNIAYVGGYDDHLHAYDIADGTELWKVLLDSDVARPAVLGDRIAVSTNNDENILYGISTEGRRVWTRKGRGGGYSSTTTAVGSVFLTTLGNKLLATAADGTPRWTYETGVIGLDLAIPVVNGDTVYVRSGKDLLALDAQGKLRRQLAVGGMGGGYVSPVVADGRLYTDTADGIVAIELST